MAEKQLGLQTLVFGRPPRIIGSATIAGPKERDGNLGDYIDALLTDSMMGEFTPEKAERKMLYQAAQDALAKTTLTEDDMDYFIGGDLLNQIISSSFCARDLGIPFIGIYGACSSMVEGLGLGALMIDGQYADAILVATSSHYQASERQFRYPVELNVQHKGTNQWTVTGAAAAVLSNQGEGPKITHATFGRVIDFGIKSPDIMGAAMAPAANDTLCRHFQDTNSSPGDYDLILTGDLGNMGQQLFVDLAKEAGYTLGTKHKDVGASIYKPHQRTGAGGSGCACVALGIMGYVIKEMCQGRYRRVLALATGALFSPLSYQQGESIGGIAHAVVIDNN
ncbi:MAG: stage V sporulation protein AD [Firmicutes bacterium]|nr:stage V sporulation protein AD [Bacillota bacterium]